MLIPTKFRLSRLLPFAFAFCLSKLQRRGGEIKHLAQTMPHAPRFRLRRRCSALIVNRLAANGFRPLLFALRS